MANDHAIGTVSPHIPDYDIVPGTVYLVQGAHQAGFSSQDIVLHPTPSSDPSDPLRWSFWRKTYHLFLLFWYSSVLGAVTNWESVIYLNLLVEYKTTIDQLNIGAAVMILLLGVGNVFFVPLSNKFGRRSIYIWTMFLVVISQIIMAVSKDIKYYQGAHFLLGMGAAPFEALVAISVSDVWFAHERGSKLGAYVFGLAFGSFIGPICAGYMVETQTWRWIYWWGVVLTGSLLILFYFTFEESRFLRSVDPDEGLVVPLPAKSALDLDDHQTPSLDDGKHDYKVDEELQRYDTHIHIAHVGEVFETTKWHLQFSLWKSYPDPWRQVCREFLAPLSVSWLPAVFWCGLNYGTCVAWLSVMATTVAEVFAVPPYNFSNSALGLIWLAPLLGSLIGAVFSGPINDRFTLYLSNKNKGFREPEFRLWAFIPTAFIMPCGLILYGVTSAHEMHWIIPIVGTGLVGFGLSVGGAVTMSYILDCYKEIGTQAITSIILIRNIVGFGITWGIQPWIEGMGQQNAFICVGVLSFVVTMAALVFILFGKRFRRITAKRYQSMAMKVAVY